MYLDSIYAWRLGSLEFLEFMFNHLKAFFTYASYQIFLQTMATNVCVSMSTYFRSSNNVHIRSVKIDLVFVLSYLVTQHKKLCLSVYIHLEILWMQICSFHYNKKNGSAIWMSMKLLGFIQRCLSRLYIKIKARWFSISLP